MESGTGNSPCGTFGKYREKWEDRPIKLYNRFGKFLLTIPFKAVTRVQIPLGTPGEIRSPLALTSPGVFVLPTMSVLSSPAGRFRKREENECSIWRSRKICENSVSLCPSKDDLKLIVGPYAIKRGAVTRVCCADRWRRRAVRSIVGAREKRLLPSRGGHGCLASQIVTLR